MPAALRSQLPFIVAAAQVVYDEWSQDEEGYDEEVGSGGICDGIAEAMVDVLTTAGIEAVTVHFESDNHTVTAALVDGRTYLIDIPLWNYETGGWYNYKKIPGVTFNEGMVTVEEAPVPFENYTEM